MVYKWCLAGEDLCCSPRHDPWPSGPIPTNGLAMKKKSWKPRPLDLLLMVQKSGDHQLRLVVFPIIYKVYTSQVVSRISEPSSTVWLMPNEVTIANRLSMYDMMTFDVSGFVNWWNMLIWQKSWLLWHNLYSKRSNPMKDNHTGNQPCSDDLFI